MSGKNLVVVFVELLNEGSESFRPVIAEELGNDRLRILELPEYKELEEDWAVLPGSFVKSVKRTTQSGEVIEVAFPLDEET